VGSLAAALSAAVIACVVAALGLAAAHAFGGEAAAVGRVVAAFEAGGARGRWWAPAPPWDDAFRAKDARASVPRPELIADLAALLRPAATDQYVLVVGESGTGKSTAVRDAMRALPAPKGAVYFSAPELVGSFSRYLAIAVDYAPPFDPLASVWSRLGGQAPAARGADGVAWPELRGALQLAAARFHAKHARPAVLVIDAADYVAKLDATLFRDLQNFAKVCADAGSLRIVFVSSEGAALPLMRAASAWSRALKPPYEVQDIDDALAVDYLVGRGAARSAAQEAVRTVTGGRFALLLDVAGAARAEAVAAIANELDVRTSTVLATLGLAPTHAFFRALDGGGRVKSDAALGLLPAAALAALLAENVIALHADGAYTAHARHVESFLRSRNAAGLGELT